MPGTLIRSAVSKLVLLAAVVGAVTGLATLVRSTDEPTTWAGGTIERGSIMLPIQTSHGSRFVMRHGWGLSLGTGQKVVVAYDGAMPDTVCNDSEVEVEGSMHGDHFDAIRVFGGAPSKYDPCRRWFCTPDAERPAHCRRMAKFE